MNTNQPPVNHVGVVTAFLIVISRIPQLGANLEITYVIAAVGFFLLMGALANSALRIAHYLQIMNMQIDRELRLTQDPSQTVTKE
jgi:hypothetical protein